MDDRRLDVLARRRGGVLALADAEHLGMTRAALAEHARRRGWSRPHPGVLVVPGTERTFRHALTVVVRAVGARRALLGGRTAAYLWGVVTRPPRHVTLLVPKNRYVPQLSTLRLPVTEAGRRWTVTVGVRRTRTLVAADAARKGGLPVTTPARTMADLASATPLDDLRSLVIDARQRRILRLEELERVHARIPRYPGRPRVARVLRDLDEEDCDSRLEWEFRRRIRARGFRPYPEPFPYRCADGIVIEIDVAFPDRWVAVECDGLSSRAERSSLATHHRRQNRAVADGWRPLLVDWTRATHDTDALCDELGALLRAPTLQQVAALPSDSPADPRFRGRRRR